MTVKMVTRPSMISGADFRVTVDAYSLNGPAADYKSVNPDTYRLALSKAGEPPKMFSAGTADLPLFTASGIPPESLLKLPYAVRNYAAAVTDLAEIHHLFEMVWDPHLVVDHPGLSEAIMRVRDWAAGRADLPALYPTQP